VAKLNPDGSLSRFGGITVSTGGVTGQIIALGNAFGDLNISGGLSGRIAVKGNKGEFGLTSFRYGILGNVSIGGGFRTTGAVVSSGLIGDDGADNIKNDQNGTHITLSGSDSGLLAADEDISFGAGFGPNPPNVVENASGTNQIAIDAVFTYNNGVLLDVLDPTQLASIVKDLLALQLKNGKLSGTTP
jgi:hypothetical protein